MIVVYPNLILRKDNKLLLSRRANIQEIWPNHWHCVTGRIEEGETPKEAIIREAYEEIGVTLKDNLELVTTISLKEKDSSLVAEFFYGLELFFLCDILPDQVPFNKEPHKHDALEWFAFDNLPSPMIPGIKFGLECFLKKMSYGELHNNKLW